MRLSPLRRSLALLVAAALGLALPAYRLFQGPRRSPAANSPGEADAVLSPLRAALPPGARLGVAVLEDPATSASDAARLYLTEYALAPAIATPVMLRDCFERGREACGLGKVGFLTLAAPEPHATQIAALLGLVPVARSGEVVLLGRRAP